LGIAAIAAIALHTALWDGTTVHVAAVAVDPFSVICHSGGEADATSDPAPAAPASIPSHACDHCNLCGATPSSAVSPAAAIIEHLPVLQSRQIEPASNAARTGLKISLKGARGPPVTA
jgi:hypothetical protein